GGGGQVTVWVIGEDGGSVIKNDVEDDPHAVDVRSVHEFLEIVGRAKSWVDLQVILDAVPVVRLLEGDLLEDRAEPEGRHTHPLEVAERSEEHTSELQSL